MAHAKRVDGRAPNELRKIKLTRNVLKFADASCLIEWGDTKVICTATVDEKVPPFLKGKGTGWVTAEYGMLPRSSKERISREAAKGRLSGRTQEIQRLIGRSLRSVMDMAMLGERMVIVDCDVIQADGGTRTASITGGFVALVEALRHLKRQKLVAAVPIKDFVVAVSVGIVKGQPMLDLPYVEDSTADVDMNVVMTGRGQFIEIQGTAEHAPFSSSELDRLVGLAHGGVKELLDKQRKVLKADSPEDF